jgi:microcystin-dependent protein
MNNANANFPLDFSLYDENDYYVLYITDDPAEKHRLNIEIINNSGRDIAFLNPVSASQCHFELKLRKGTLSRKTLYLLQHPDVNSPIIESSNWFGTGEAWLVQLDSNDPTTDSLYFTFKMDPKYYFANPILVKDNSLILNLQNLSADAGNGARGTRVEFIPHQLVFNDDQTPVTGNREQHLYISNHQGQKHIPLHVGFAGSNRIVNDGVAHDPLILQLANIAMPDPGQNNGAVISFLRGDDSQNIPTSRILVTFDAQEDGGDEPWALGTFDELKDFKITPKDGDMWDANELTNQQGETPVWALTPKQDCKLAWDKPIYFSIENIKSSLDSGPTYLYVNYENIPGYWDGKFVCAIEKSPVQFYNDDENAWVVINSSKRFGKKALELTSDSSPDDMFSPTLIVNHIRNGFSALFEGQVKMGSGQGPTLSVLGGQGEAAVFDGRVTVNGGTTDASLQVNPGSGGDAASFGGRVTVNGSTSDASLQVNPGSTGEAATFGGRVTVNGSTSDASLQVNPGSTGEAALFNGRVEVSGSLDVNERIKDQTGYLTPVGSVIAYLGRVAPDGWLFCNGQQIPNDPKYDQLKQVLGTPNIPDLTGRSLIGSGGNYILGKKDGEATHTLTVSEMPAHTHNYHKPKWDYAHADSLGHISDWTRYGNQNQVNDEQTVATGTGQPHNNMPPYYVVNYIIKY